MGSCVTHRSLVELVALCGASEAYPAINSLTLLVVHTASRQAYWYKHSISEI